RARRSIVLGRSVDPRGGFGLPWPAFRPTRAALASSAKKNPRQFPAGGSFRDVVRRLGLPDALSAEHDGPGVLVAKGRRQPAYQRCWLAVQRCPSTSDQASN